MRPVKRSETHEAAHNVVHVGAEHAAVNVKLVQHDEPQSPEKRRPIGVMGEDARVEHVGIRDQNVGRVPFDLAAHMIGRVAVVDRDARRT